MTPLEQEILALTKKWYAYVSIDHHKDRDCHWTIQQYFSYGDEPYYQAEHYGYIGDDFEGTRCDTLEEAQEELRDKLLFSIHNAKQWLSREIKDYEANPNEMWFGDVEVYKKTLAMLEENSEGIKE